ncbi:MAG: toxin-antitoxin system TumE family protein [Candidatus Binatia bacterium]
MTSRDYYRSVLQLFTTSTVVTSQRIEFDEQDVYVAYLKGSISLTDNSTLFFAQYVRIEDPASEQINRKKYRYHWQAPNGETRYRWDNARHYPSFGTFPDHRHIGPDEKAQESGPADLWQVMKCIEKEI